MTFTLTKVFIFEKCLGLFVLFHAHFRQGRIAVPRRETGARRLFINPSAWGHLNRSSYCDVGRLFYGVFKLWSKLQRKK